MKQHFLLRNLAAASACLIIIACLPACKKFLDVSSSDTQITAAQVFSNEQSAYDAVSGLYAQIMKTFDFMNGYISRFPGLYSDELTRSTPNSQDMPFLSNNLSVNDQTVATIWKSGYSYIYQANALIEGLGKSTALSARVCDQLAAQARFVRGLTYFYMVNLFGDVPLVLETSYEDNAVMPRTPAVQVYQQIVTDLLTAQATLSATSNSMDSLITRRNWATRWAPTALLARVYLYQEDWTNAALQASLVIDSGPFRLNDSLNLVFLASSNESIFQLAPTSASYNTAEGVYFVVADGQRPTYLLTDVLINAFDPGDARMNNWVKMTKISGQKYYSPYKYKAGFGSVPYTEYNIVLRLAEQYLIRAEARTHLGRIGEAVNDLNTIRRRANLAGLPGSLSPMQLLLAIVHERQVELFAEWGHRWFDLKRLPSLLYPSDSSRKSADDVIPVKSVGWLPYRLLFPIPSGEILKNGALTQNPGY